jgi:hypothetical protein
MALPKKAGKSGNKAKQNNKGKPAQDMVRKARVRKLRNKGGGPKSDYQVAVRRGDENAGSASKSATTHRDKAAHEKKTGKKVPKGKDFGHKVALKNGGGSAGGAESKSKNRSKGGKSGNSAGKAAGGRKSKPGKMA